MSDWNCSTPHRVCNRLSDEKAALELEVSDLKVDLAAQKDAHDRYRELVRSNLAEQEWKKDNDKLRAQLADARCTALREAAAIARSYAYSGASTLARQVAYAVERRILAAGELDGNTHPQLKAYRDLEQAVAKAQWDPIDQAYLIDVHQADRIRAAALATGGLLR
jgi:hypothetical protein